MTRSQENASGGLGPRHRSIEPSPSPAPGVREYYHLNFFFEILCILAR